MSALPDNQCPSNRWHFTWGTTLLHSCSHTCHHSCSHTCHHQFCGDWDWPLSQPDTQSLTWFDYKRRTFKSCIMYPFTSALQPVGLWRCAHFWQLCFRLERFYLQKNKWIFSCISSWFSVFPFCLPPLYYFSLLFFFKFAILMTVPQSAHWCDATEHLQLCTDLTSLLRSCKNTYYFTFFALMHCIFFRLFFFKLCTFGYSSHADKDSTTVSSIVWCHWVPATMTNQADEFLSELWKNFNVSFLFFFALEIFFFTFSWSACGAGELKICIEQPRCLKHTAWHFILQISYKLFSFW